MLVIKNKRKESRKEVNAIIGSHEQILVWDMTSSDTNSIHAVIIDFDSKITGEQSRITIMYETQLDLLISKLMKAKERLTKKPNKNKMN